MAIDFPDAPSNGDTHTVGDKTWTYDGTTWTLVTGATADHGNLGGLGDDDHTQYLLADGTRTATELTVSGDLTVDTDTLHVDSTNDRVGIGTTSPNTTLELSGLAPYLRIHHADTALSNDEDAGRIEFSNEDSGGATGPGAYIGSVGDGSAGHQSLVFGVGAAGSPSEAVRIDGTTGRVGIGDNNPSYTLDVNGDINATGDVRVAGTAIGRGVVDYERVTGGTNPRVYTAYVETDLSTITFTASEGRLYKATGIVHVFSAPSLCQAFGIIELNGSNLTATYQTSEGTSYYSSIVTIGTFTASGSTTVKFQIRPNNSLNVYMGGSEGWLLLIEDIGPS